MIPLVYLFALAIGLIGIAFAGIASDKHFIVIMLAIELILVASTILLVSFFAYAPVTSANSTAANLTSAATAASTTTAQKSDPGALVMLMSIWTVAAVEIITLITFYLYMKQKDVEFDVTKLSRLKW